VACTPCLPGKDQEKGEVVVVCGPYPPFPRLLVGILVPLVWVHLYVYLDNPLCMSGIIYSLQKW
jgi:hypothetical protein